MHGSSDAMMMMTQQTPERRRHHNSNWPLSPAIFQPSPGQHVASPAQQYDLINLFQSPQRPVADAAALDLLLAATPGSTPLQAKGSMFSPSPAPRSRASSGGRPRARAVSLEAVGWDLRGQQQGAAGSSLGGLPPGLLGPEGAEPGIQDMVSDLLRSPSAKVGARMHAHLSQPAPTVHPIPCLLNSCATSASTGWQVHTFLLCDCIIDNMVQHQACSPRLRSQQLCNAAPAPPLRSTDYITSGLTLPLPLQLLCHRTRRGA